MTQLPENLYTTFDEFIKNKITPILKDKGFKKKRYIWNRKRGNFVDVVDFQISRKCSDETIIDFTINFGICVPAAVIMIFDTIKTGEKNFIREGDCIIRARPGELNVNPEIFEGGSWWKVSSKEEIEKAFDEIEDLLKTKALLFINYFDSMEKIIDFKIKKSVRSVICDYEQIQLAIILFITGRKEESRETLMKIINKELGWREKATLVAQKLGLTI